MVDVAFVILTILARKPGDDVMARASAGRVWDLPVPVVPEPSGGSKVPVDPSDEVVDGVTPAAPTTLAAAMMRAEHRRSGAQCENRRIRTSLRNGRTCNRATLNGQPCVRASSAAPSERVRP